MLTRISQGDKWFLHVSSKINTGQFDGACVFLWEMTLISLLHTSLDNDIQHFLRQVNWFNQTIVYSKYFYMTEYIYTGNASYSCDTKPSYLYLLIYLDFKQSPRNICGGSLGLLGAASQRQYK